ncbi:MAG: T9SS type A sorting domain-containing protein, partial [Bacteroidota bacterium]
SPNPFDVLRADVLTISNNGPFDITLDSLNFTSLSGYTAIGWVVDYQWVDDGRVVRGSALCSNTGHGFSVGCEDWGNTAGRHLFGRMLAPADSVSITRLEAGCFICASSAPWTFEDTLLVYSGGLPRPQAVPILNYEVVSTERSLPETTVQVSAYPNPTRNRISLDVTVPSFTDMLIDVVNVVGQRVAGPVRQTLTAGTHTLLLPLDGLPAGTYHLIIRSTDGAIAERTHRSIVVLK